MSPEPPRAAAAASTAPTPLRVQDLFLLSTLAAFDGTLVLLAAAGALATLSGAAAIGLTTVAGAGAWVASREVFGGRAWTSRDRVLLGLLGLAMLGATAAAAWLGQFLGGAVELRVLPRAAGVAVLLVAAHLAGLAPARLGPVPLPAAVAAAGAAVEGVLQWTP